VNEEVVKVIPNKSFGRVERYKVLKSGINPKQTPFIIDIYDFIEVSIEGRS
jgi:hypothetical protein